MSRFASFTSEDVTINLDNVVMFRPHEETGTLFTLVSGSSIVLDIPYEHMVKVVSDVVVREAEIHSDTA